CESHNRATGGQNQAFNQRLRDHCGARRTERITYADLTLSRRRAHEQEVGHIRACNEEHDAHGREQSHERWSQRTNELLAKRDDVDGPAGIRLREVASDISRDMRKILFGVCRGNTRLQSANQREALASSIATLLR